MVKESDLDHAPHPNPNPVLGLVVGNYCHDVLFRDGQTVAKSLGGAASFISNLLDSFPLSFRFVAKAGPDFAYSSLIRHPPLLSPSPTTLFHAHLPGPTSPTRTLLRVSACDAISPSDLPNSPQFDFGIAAAVAAEIPPETLASILDRCRTVLVDAQGLIRNFSDSDSAVTLVPLAETKFAHFLPRIAFLKASSEEAPFLDLEEVRKLCCVIVTDGGEGCRVYWKDGMVKVAPFPAVEVDPTGAGDSFLGGFVVGLANGLTVPDAALLGNFFGSLTVVQIGIPKFDPGVLQVRKMDLF